MSALSLITEAGTSPSTGFLPASPDPKGIPGSAVLNTLANGVEGWALIAAVVGIVVGAIVWAFGHYSQNYQQAFNGRKGVLVSGLAALLIGAAPYLIHSLQVTGTGVADRRPVTAALILPPVPAIPGIGILAGAGTSLAKGAATAIFDGLSGWLIAGAAALVTYTVTLIGSTSPDLTAAWYEARMKVMVLILGMMVWPLLAAATIGAVLRQDLRRLGRTWGVALPVALIVGGGAIPLTGEALRVSDALTSVLWDDEGGAVRHALTRLASAMTSTIGTGNSFVAAIVALVVIAGAVLLWVELLLRSAAIYVAVAFLPLALAGLVWPATLHWSRRLVEILVALILSKFVIVAAITMAIGAIGTARTADQVLAGGAILLMAGYAPFLLLRLAPVMEAAAIGHLEGASHRPYHAAQRLASRAAALPNHPLVGYLSEQQSGFDQPASSPVTSQPLAPTGGGMDREYAAVAASISAGSGERADGDVAPTRHAGGDDGTVDDER